MLSYSPVLGIETNVSGARLLLHADRNLAYQHCRKARCVAVSNTLKYTKYRNDRRTYVYQEHCLIDVHAWENLSHILLSVFSLPVDQSIEYDLSGFKGCDQPSPAFLLLQVAGTLHMPKVLMESRPPTAHSCMAMAASACRDPQGHSCRGCTWRCTSSWRMA